MLQMYKIFSDTGPVLNYSNPVLTFIFLYLYSLAVIVELFALSTLFSRPNIALGKLVGSSALNPGAVFPCFFTEAFLLFLAPAGGSNPAGESFTLST